MGDNNKPETKFEMHMPEGYAKIHHRHLGPILAVLVIVLLLIFGGLYLWGGMIAEQVTPEPVIINNEPETPRATADAQILETTSPSDELDAIEADLTSTNLDSLDADITAAEGELDLQVQ